ncbi:MAG TPA: hypothetical protein VJJ26_01965 [Candidatus Babeliales bacterium]|nr:hypothetical protein [Candidatus Babeliales bacterium]
MNKKIGISFLTLSLSLCLTSAELIEGDKDAPEGQTFSFSVNRNIFSSTGNFYESANENLTANQEFTISRLIRGTKAFAPLTPETITLGGVQNAPNPLFGTKILALGMLETEDGLFLRDIPVVVGENKPATVYLFENISQPTNIEVEFSQDVHDAQGNVSNGIVDLTTNNIGHVFAAAKPNGGEFGDLNSGIALLVRGTIDVPQGEDKTRFRIFSEVNANTGSIIQPQALRLDPTSPAIAINNPLANIVNNQVAMHWDASLERLFIGLQTTANSGINDGTRAVAVCKFIEDGAITLETIVPDSVFTTGSTTNIIGARGANQQVSIHALNTMYTSTALNYLIVVGNVGNPASTHQSVFALPLVNTGDVRGTIAQKDAQPHNVFRDAPVPRLIARTISEPAITASQMTQSTDSAAQVGSGQLLAGPIVNIIVRDDTVFAYVGENMPGVYSSQAIFDAAGKITSWSQWQRAAGTTDTIFAAALNAFEGNFILASGTTTDTVNTVKRTLWSDGSPEGLQPLTTILDNTLVPSNGGTQGMQTFLPNTPGLQNISVLAAGGIGNILLAQTGILSVDDIIIPTPGADFNQLEEFTNGTITNDVAAKTVVISGGALTTVGPITALEIARNASDGWLFVGGSNGLAILAQEDGTGWNAATQLGDNLDGLATGMQFKIIGNYSFVKKLIHDGNFLFVITHSTIDRINLTSSDFGTNTLDVITIASIGNNVVANRGGFLDGIFSQALGIIATTDGLLRIGNGKDIRTITNEADAQWIPLAIGENAGAPIALYTVTATNRLQNITNFNGGYFYVLTADVGLDQSRINRFAVQPLGATDAVSSTTVQAFDDLFVKNIPSFLLSFGEFRSNFATDGALYFATRNQNVLLAPIVMLTPSSPVPRVGVGNVGDRSTTVRIDVQQGSEINYFSRSAASGSWIAAGNFDTQVLE